MPHPSPKVDPDLLRRLREGDDAAFKEIYDCFAPILYQRLLRLLKDPDTVEEILQDTFLKLWEKRAQIDPQRAFKTYLYRITDHLAIDVFRKITRDKALQQELWASTVSSYLHTEEALIAKEEQQLLSAAINQLPPKRKQILLLCKLHEKSYQEVADLMGISVSTVSNQLVKAIKEIKNFVLHATRSEHALLLFLLIASRIF